MDQRGDERLSIVCVREKREKKGERINKLSRRVMRRIYCKIIIPGQVRCRVMNSKNARFLELKTFFLIFPDPNCLCFATLFPSPLQKKHKRPCHCPLFRFSFTLHTLLCYCFFSPGPSLVQRLTLPPHVVHYSPHTPLLIPLSSLHCELSLTLSQFFLFLHSSSSFINNLHSHLA